MIAIVSLSITTLYVAIAAYIWWMFVAHSKVGMRQTWRQTTAVARREGVLLVLMALGWLPIMLVALVGGPSPEGSSRRKGVRP